MRDWRQEAIGVSSWRQSHCQGNWWSTKKTIRLRTQERPESFLLAVVFMLSLLFLICHKILPDGLLEIW